MSTVNQLYSELTNLASETKRRNHDIREASEAALEILRRYNPATGEAEFLHELSHHDKFIEPFILACATRNGKYSAIAVQCLSRLIMAKGLPVRRLPAVIDAFIEASHLAIEIQLKILQTLPALFANYGIYMHDDMIANVLLVCAMLQGATKVPVVVNTAAATLQQLVVGVFDKVVVEDTSAKGRELMRPFAVPVDGGSTINIAQAAYDAQRVFADLCNLLERRRPSFLRFNYLAESLGFELVESVLKSHSGLFSSHEELGFILRTRVVPLLLRTFSGSHEFALCVRVARCIKLCVEVLLPVVSVECEVVLSVLSHFLPAESGMPYWKRVLCMEVFRSIFSQFELVSKLYGTYDLQEGCKTVVKDVVAVFASVVAENESQLSPASRLIAYSEPALLGESNSNSNSIEQPDNGNPMNLIVGSIVEPKVPLLELLDKTKAPPVHSQYLVWLVLLCVTSLAEELGRYVVRVCGSSKRELREAQTQETQNLSTMQDSQNVDETYTEHSARDTIETTSLPQKLYDTSSTSAQSVVCAGLIEACWSSLFELYGTLIYSKIDEKTFHKVLRSYQRLTHASGLLELSGPRDAMIRMLAEAAVRERNPAKANEPYASNSRNVLCLRALLSLVLALGPTLDDLWPTVFVCLQWASRGRSLAGPSVDFSMVDQLYERICKSTAEYPEQFVLDMLYGLRRLAAYSFGGLPSGTEDDEDPTPVNYGVAGSQVIPFLPLKGEGVFFVRKMMEILRSNFSRMGLVTISTSTMPRKWWNLAVEICVEIMIEPTFDSEARKDICGLLADLCTDFVVYLTGKGNSTGISDEALVVAVKPLEKAVSGLTKCVTGPVIEKTLPLQTESHMYSIILQTVCSLIDRTGQGLGPAWRSIFRILNCPFDISTRARPKLKRNLVSTELVKALDELVILLTGLSFQSVQLVCNDFLPSVALSAMKPFIDTLFLFCRQDYEMNTAFSAISYFWMLSSHLTSNINAAEYETYQQIQTFESLNARLDLVSQNDMEPSKASQVLWVYLLIVLGEITTARNPQVRDGAIQTLLGIIELQGKQLSPQFWTCCFRFVLKGPMSLHNKVTAALDRNSVKEVPLDQAVLSEWSHSVGLVVAGTTKLLLSFVTNFTEDPSSVALWSVYVEYLAELRPLGWPGCNISTFKALQDILKELRDLDVKSGSVPVSVVKQLLDFWLLDLPELAVTDEPTAEVVRQNVETTTEYLNCLQPFLSLIESRDTSDKLELQSEPICLKIVSRLDQAAEYPYLAPAMLDTAVCPPLQKQVLACMYAIQPSCHPVARQILLSVARYSQFALESSGEITTQVKPTNYSPATFVAFSGEAVTLLKVKFAEILDKKPLVADETMAVVTKALHRIERTKFTGNHEPPTWVEASSVLLGMIDIVLDVLRDESSMKFSLELRERYWDLFVRFGQDFISGEAEPKKGRFYQHDYALYEQRDLELYSAFRDMVLAELRPTPGVADTGLEKILETALRYSFLYDIDEVLLLLGFEPSGDMLSKSNFDVVLKQIDREVSQTGFGTMELGTTQTMALVSRPKMAMTLLEDLIRLSVHENENLARQSFPMLFIRAALTLVKYLNDQQLRGKMPMPLLHRREIEKLLEGLIAVLDGKQAKLYHQQFQALYRILTAAVPVAHRDYDGLVLMSRLFSRMGTVFGICAGGETDVEAKLALGELTKDSSNSEAEITV